jgi:hypothetical protein
MGSPFKHAIVVVTNFPTKRIAPAADCPSAGRSRLTRGKCLHHTKYVRNAPDRLEKDNTMPEDPPNAEPWTSGLKIQKTRGFRVTVGTEPDFDNPIADLYLDDEIVAVIMQEGGYGTFTIELWPRKDGSKWQLDLAGFEQAVAEATLRLRRLNGSGE